MDSSAPQSQRTFFLPIIWAAGLLLVVAGIFKLIAPPPSVEFCTASFGSSQRALGLRDRSGALANLGFQPGSSFAVWDSSLHRIGHRQRAVGDAGRS